jgi:hypothetical protein
MKYIDADLLREKIAEQMESLPRKVGRGAGTITPKGYGMMEAFQIMRSIIDSLPEQPVEWLEEEIQRYFDGWGEIGDGDNIVTKNSDYIGLKDLPNIARHFAEWGAEHLKK